MTTQITVCLPCSVCQNRGPPSTKMTMMVHNNMRCFLLLALTLSKFCICQECTAEEDESSCSSNRSCDFDANLCQSAASVYEDGGTAVSFRPLTTSKSTVCSRQSRSYRIANWFGRRAAWTTAPRVILHVEVLGCATEEASCCCAAVTDGSVHVWQTQPDGTYASLGNKDSDECRGYQEGSSSFTFETLAPGSVGSMGGLGPNGWDVPPYVGPVIHVLAQGRDKAPVLVDIPLHPNPAKAMQQSRFFGPNFHGSAWVSQQSSKNSSHRYRLTAWEASENRIEVSVQIHLAAASTTTTDLKTSLCPSFLYGLPGSFFTEPIELCAPALLKFLTL